VPKRYLVTSGLPYSNNRLHVGHIAGAYLPADTYVRYLRACGHDVLYVCGSDDNGVAIEISAEKAGTTPQAISTRFHEQQKRDFAGLRIDFDVYGGTHQPTFYERHRRFSSEFFKTLYDKGYFTKRITKQFYDPQKERFLPDRYVKGTCYLCKDHETYGDQCEKTGQVLDALLLLNPVSVLTGATPAVRETAHWYLRLSDFEEPLATWLESKQGQWRPQVLNFALGQIKQGLPERAMTRDITWGIPVPLDDPDAAGKVLYVWFDAPIGYISFTAQLLAERTGDERAYRDWWCDPDTPIVHFIGEDNTIFHTLIWPAMLMADGRHQLPHAVVANSFLNFGSDKISKSRTAEDSPVWIAEFLKRFDPDALRYYLTAIAPESARTTFEPADFITRNNSELVAALGNFINRWPKFVTDDFGGKVPAAGPLPDADRALLAQAAQALRQVGQLIEEFRFRAALEAMMAFTRQCNEWIGLRAPWKSRKADLADCAACIATCIHATQFLAVMMHPFMPGAAERVCRLLNVGGEALRWTPPAPLSAGHALGAAKILFAKLEPNAMD
jgi:methionyl-tRNA synthetase